ncbi:MAG TPA: hypothetical protein VH158_08535 [Gemmatimonadales bacterium]|jgi:DNA polymerase-3 subunit delta'|nr:hypothetical protein [Gemmatimonadales bacterium]
MPIPPLSGHEGIRHRLVGAIASGRLPQALLFEGPRGVGKQRLALWLAQALVCEAPASERENGEGCGRCRHCTMVLGLSHPDVHWFVPVELATRGADADKQVELVREALAEEMAARRGQPLYEPAAGLASHGIASVRLLLGRLALTPALARRKVFILGDAERLVPQPGADAAANALLKALEEPPADTVFVLTAVEPDALPATILSRVVRVRVARLADSIVAAFAQRQLGLTAQRELAERVGAAEGCIGKLLASGTPGELGAGAAERFLTAVAAGPVERYAFALAQQPFQARGAFTEMLDGLLRRLREHARTGRETGKVVTAISRVLEARGLAQGNVNPQLVAAVLGQAVAEGGPA